MTTLLVSLLTLVVKILSMAQVIVNKIAYVYGCYMMSPVLGDVYSSIVDDLFNRAILNAKYWRRDIAFGVYDSHKPIHRWCNCIYVVSPKEMFPYLLEEIKEFIACPSEDEASDVLWCISRMLGGLFNKIYLPIPGIDAHITKMDNRMQMWGCVRSENHPHCYPVQDLFEDGMAYARRKWMYEHNAWMARQAGKAVWIDYDGDFYDVWF